MGVWTHSSECHAQRSRQPLYRPADSTAASVAMCGVQELFRVRRKEFWPLPKADNLLNKFIPNLCHEADGLIFQRE